MVWFAYEGMSGVSPWFPAGITGCSLTCSTPSLHRKRAYQRTRKRRCVSCQHTSLNASNIICRRGKKPQNKTKRNKTQGQRMTALPSRGSNAVSAASSCILTQYLDDGSFSPMLLIQHCTAVVSQAPRRIPFTNRALCFVFGVFVALVRLEYRGNGDFDHRRTCPSNSGPVWTHFHSKSFSLLIH